MKPKIGVLGCGNISSIYFENLTTRFTNIDIHACSDLIADNANNAAKRWNIPNIMTAEQMFDCPDIDIILNITAPAEHYPLTKQAIESGKHVYVEKPLSLTFEQGKTLTNLAKSKSLMLGGAPDTFLGAGIQTCVQLIESGAIGKITGASAFMVCSGHEHWHPSPEFYYLKGGGPMFDMGPYYLTALITLIGNITEVCGMTSTAHTERVIKSNPKQGKIMQVETPTHVNGLLRFENNAVATIITSFDVWGSNLPRIEVYGTKGAILVPDPNTFGGPVFVAKDDYQGFKEIPISLPHETNSRGLGLSEMALAITGESTGFRANANLMLHALEVMEALHYSDNSRTFYKVTTSAK